MSPYIPRNLLLKGRISPGFFIARFFDSLEQDDTCTFEALVMDVTMVFFSDEKDRSCAAACCCWMARSSGSHVMLSTESAPRQTIYSSLKAPPSDYMKKGNGDILQLAEGNEYREGRGGVFSESEGS